MAAYLRGFLARLAALALAAAMAACVTPSTDGAPSSREPSASRGAAATDKTSVYVRDVLARLAKADRDERSWTISILNVPDVNAFALPDGRVYVTRGLLVLLDNEAQLAAVVGHEMAHVTARHAEARRALRRRNVETALSVARSTGDARLTRDAVTLGVLDERAYSRDQEFEADRIGIATLGRAGYEVDAAIAALTRLREHDLLEARLASRSPDLVDSTSNMMSTHPRTIDRVKKARDLVASAQAKGETNRDRYLDAIDGMLFGDEPRQGFVRGRSFLHPEMGFAFTVPPGFRLRNTPSSVMAIGPDDSGMLFTCRPGGGDEPMVETMRGLLPSVTLEDARAAKINGMDAAIGQHPRGAGADEDFRVVAIRFTPHVCVFLMRSTTSGRPDRGGEMERAAQSFRRLTQAERARLRPFRLKVITVSARDTPRQLAARMPLGESSLDWFNTLNGLQPGEALRPGQRVKIVVQD